MASESSKKSLLDQVTCSICRDFFTNPVFLDCEHNFCYACIVRSWRDSPMGTACPLCGERVHPWDLMSNRQLAKVVKIVKELCELPEKEAGGHETCEQHQEPLKLFCQDDQAPICVVCDRSKEHRDHDVIPLEEAAREFKDQLCSRLEILEKEREKFLGYKADTEKESQDLLRQICTEREKIVVEFRQLHQLMEEEEKRLLDEMEEVERTIAQKRDEHMARVSGQLSSLEKTIQEMEKQHHLPAVELLKDVRSTLQRHENKELFETPVAFPLDLKWMIWDFCDVTPFLEGVRKQFEDTLGSRPQLQRADVTLDPATAHPFLILSANCKNVRRGRRRQDWPDNPGRFSKQLFVLGREGFTAGQHFWDVTVGGEEGWAVGVARESVRRKEKVVLHPWHGIWAVGKWGAGYRTLNPPNFLPETLSGEPRRIRVTLNCTREQVAFFDADTGAQLYAFPQALFSGETILPFFCVYVGSHLTLSS